MRYVMYVKTGCPYCARVLDFASKHGIEFEFRNSAEPGVRAELEARGGKQQFPYLIDIEKGVEMYESADIIAYLGKEEGVASGGAQNGGTCPIE